MTVRAKIAGMMMVAPGANIGSSARSQSTGMTPSGLRFTTARTQVARVAVGIAAVLGLLGQVIDFYPGAEAGWFGFAAAARWAGCSRRPGGCGLLAWSWRYRSPGSRGRATCGGGSIVSG